MCGDFLYSDKLSSAKYFLQWLTLCELIDHFIEVSHFLCERILDIFDSIPTDHPCDQVSTRMQVGTLKKDLEADLLLK